MITVSRDGLTLKIDGHAGYAPIGQDIVCAGVSALAVALLDYLQQTDNLAAFMVDNGHFFATAKRDDCSLAFAECGLRLIAAQYPQNVSFTTPKGDV